MSDSVQEIRKWMNVNGHFPYDFEDAMIVRFLFVCNEDIEETKRVLELFFKFRNEVPEFFTNRDPMAENLLKISDVVNVIALPERTSDGYQIYISRFEDPDPSKFIFEDYAKMFFNIADVRMKCEMEIPKGDITIFDMSGFTLRHFMTFMFSRSAVKKYLRITQEAHPVSLKQIHVINTLPILEKLLTFFRPLMRDEIKEMLRFHSSGSNTLDEFIPKHLLPKEYGGSTSTVADIKAASMKRIEEHREWLKSNPWRNEE